MPVDIERALEEFGDAGYSGIEVPGFADKYPLLILYKMELLAEDRVIDALDKMLGALGDANALGISWQEGDVKIEVYDLFLQGDDALFLELYVMGDDEWECPLICVVPVEDGLDGAGFSYADVYEAARSELEDMGIIG